MANLGKAVLFFPHSESFNQKEAYIEYIVE
jgi:hypothetical protein